MSKTFYLPRVTAQQIEKQLATCQNLGLILDKYPETQVPGNSLAKSSWLREIHPDKHIDSRLAQSVYSRWLRMTQAVGATLFSGTTDWRMVVGLGGETVLETDLTLHHLYGVPFIPGSSLKGLTRFYVTTEIDKYKSNTIDSDHEDIQRIFGSQKQAGTVIFFDAMPVNGETNIELDIMNPHYPDYYGKGQAPTNDQNPSPITFLTVANTTFMFALAPRRPKKDQGDVELVKTWLQEALKAYGVGGKTSAGYGYFKEVQDVQAVSQTIVSSSQAVPAPLSVPTERIRPNIPPFHEGQDIKGLVVAPTDELRQKAPTDAKAFLKYESFDTKNVLMIVNAEEAQNWKPGNTRICQFVREEVHDGCTMLVCQPRPPKDKGKKKK